MGRDGWGRRVFSWCVDFCVFYILRLDNNDDRHLQPLLVCLDALRDCYDGWHSHRWIVSWLEIELNIVVKQRPSLFDPLLQLRYTLSLDVMRLRRSVVGAF